MILKNEVATADAGAALARVARAGDVITLSGPLGVGKTALARGSSPRWAMMATCQARVSPLSSRTTTSPRRWHVDLYRIEQPSELEELGLDAAADAVLLVEWPERAGSGAWPDALVLSLDFAADGDRILTAKVPPSWESRWPPQ